MEIEGVVKFFEELGLDLMDAVTLVISYHFGAKKSVRIPLQLLMKADC